MVFEISFLLTLLGATSQDIGVSNYILNPYHVKAIPSSLPISNTEADQWLAAFYKRLSLLVTLDRHQIKDNRGESLDDKIKIATQSYLELKHDQALELSQEALQLLAESLPYKQMMGDIFDVLALRLMILESSKVEEFSDSDIPEEIRHSIANTEFQSRLPTRLNSIVRNFTLAQKFPVQFDKKSIDRIFVLGTERKFPLHLESGKYLIHRLSAGELEAQWLSIGKNGSLTFEKLWKRSIWKALPLDSLRSTLITTKPSHLKIAGVSIALKDGTLLSIVQPATSRALANNDPFEINTKSQDESEYLFKSPWFWFVTSLAAGTAGYFIYDSVQTKTATSP